MTVQLKTTLGVIAGIARDGVEIFRGIPYAKPLSGLGRIRAPEPVTPWSGVLDASQWAPAAPQEEIPLMGVGATGDNCLALNIWRPAGGLTGLPVMVWIHGGGFVTGASHQALYEASTLAAENQVVVVSINYRLGILGFGEWSAWPELEGVSNAGLRDQLLALQWVQDHIAAFGGDAGNVTLFGESAGGMSIACLLASPPAKGLFHRAILQSGSPDHVVVRSEAERVTGLFAEAAGEIQTCLTGELAGIVKAQRACFSTTVERGQHAHPMPQFGMTLLPVIGDDVLPQHPLAAIRAGASADIPVLLGTTLDEWTLFYLAPQAMGRGQARPEPDAERLAHEFERTLPGQGVSMLKRYQALMPGAANSAIFCAYETDRMFRIPTVRLAEARFAAAAAPTFNYLFDWPCAWNPRLGSCHVMEIPFVFGITDRPTGQFFTGGGEAAARLSAAVRAAWTTFARHGVPGNNPDWPQWPAYTEAERATLLIAAESRRQDDPEKERRQLWTGII